MVNLKNIFILITSKILKLRLRKVLMKMNVIHLACLFFKFPIIITS